MEARTLVSFDIDGTLETGDPAGPLRTPRRAGVSVTLAVLACAACCALPLLVGAGLLTAGAAATVNQTPIAAAIALAILVMVFLGWHQCRKIAARTVAGILPVNRGCSTVSGCPLAAGPGAEVSNVALACTGRSMIRWGRTGTLRNGVRSKTVLTGLEPVERDVSRDR